MVATHPHGRQAPSVATSLVVVPKGEQNTRVRPGSAARRHFAAARQLYSSVRSRASRRAAACASGARAADSCLPCVCARRIFVVDASFWSSSNNAAVSGVCSAGKSQPFSELPT